MGTGLSAGSTEKPNTKEKKKCLGLQHLLWIRQFCFLFKIQVKSQFRARVLELYDEMQKKSFDPYLDLIFTSVPSDPNRQRQVQMSTCTRSDIVLQTRLERVLITDLTTSGCNMYFIQHRLTKVIHIQ